MSMVSITYIWHDCFVVSTPVAVLVFDYWLDTDGGAAAHPAFLDITDRDKPLYVLVSHGHKDHFNPDIFSWAADFPNVHYIVSKDVMKRIRHVVSATSAYSGPKVSPSQVTALRPGEEFSDGRVRVAAFPSTDIGNSYIVECDGRRIFHAGDLNAWIWKDESTEQEVRKALGDYLACLRDISAWLKANPVSTVPEAMPPVQGAAAPVQDAGRIDFCFFPVDSRIGTDYFTGASIFVREFDVVRFFPMHFALGDEEERRQRRADALRFGRYANPARGEYIPLALPGSTYLCADTNDFNS